MVEKKAAHCYEMLANFYQITWFYSQKVILLQHFLCYHDNTTICLQHITVHTCCSKLRWHISSIQFTTRNIKTEQLPYFSIANAHLMYNVHPKHFQHSLHCARYLYKKSLLLARHIFRNNSCVLGQ
jgi:hypothetical protein